MSSYDLSNVLLPAVLISSAVFSTLTLPFALIKNEPIAVELPYFSGEIPPLFNSEHKDVAIPYIGISIVASVGAGIASVEVNRRWQAYRSALKEEENLPTIQQNSPENGLQQEALDLPEYRPEVSAIDLSSKEEILEINSLTVTNTVTESHHLDVETSVHFFDIAQFVDFKSTLPENTTNIQDFSETLNLKEVISENNYLQLGHSEISSNSADQELELAFTNILCSREQYQICRLEMPHLKRRLFAVLVDGEYYSFLRAEKTKDNLRATLNKLSHRVGKTVITKTEKGYAIWAWEPEVG
ncbi:MAG: hypothetical protein U7123_19745 [Potamolinea sp.]